MCCVGLTKMLKAQLIYAKKAYKYITVYTKNFHGSLIFVVVLTTQIKPTKIRAPQKIRSTKNNTSPLYRNSTQTLP